MEPEPVRQFVSKAARCKAPAAFELCAPDTGQRSNRGRYFELSSCLPRRASWLGFR